MSLSKFSQIHPYVSRRVKFLLEIADRHGGKYTVTSGNRTPDEQARLMCRGRGHIVAKPGCSQHQYGLAMDVAFKDPRWQDWYLQGARKIGLVTVGKDRVHVQALPANVIVPFLERLNLCPTPRYRGYRCGPLPK